MNAPNHDASYFCNACGLTRRALARQARRPFHEQDVAYTYAWAALGNGLMPRRALSDPEAAHVLDVLCVPSSMRRKYHHRLRLGVLQQQDWFAYAAAAILAGLSPMALPR
jgi:hypothetical protein